MSNLKELVSKADLHYQGIDRVSESGIPVGNGRMGSLLWMDPEELHMQWNRVDVFANDATSQSFPEMDSDYAHATGLIDISFGSGKNAVFSENTTQYLSVYDGRAEIHSADIKVDVFPDMDKDICYICIRDDREIPQKIRLSLRTVRGGSMYKPGVRPQIHPALMDHEIYTYVKTGDHLATSCLKAKDKTVSLRQYFEEKDYICQSLLEVKTYGRDCEVRIRNQFEVIMEWEAKKGEFWVVVGTAQSFGREAIASDLHMLNGSKEELLSRKEESESWWHSFWERAPKIDMHSEDGKADAIALHCTYFLYLMAITSRGRYMPRYGGLLFITGGDYRYWGAQFWWHNQLCYYNALIKMGCFELADAMYEHVLNNMESYEKAAQQQWGTKGIFIPETCWFSGPCDIPEEMQDEFRALYTGKKAWKDRSEAFDQFARGRNVYESRWNWKLENGKYGPYAYVTHIFSTAAKVAMKFWMRYVETGDLDWLKEKAYPVLKGTALMYQNLPFIEEGEDGYLHINHVNDHEDSWNACDTIAELSGIHGIMPVAARAAEILGIDEVLREEWKEFERKMVPFVTNESSRAILPKQPGEDTIWCCGATPVEAHRSGFYHVLDSIIYYHTLTMETGDGEIRQLGENTYRKCLERHTRENGRISIDDLDPFVIATGKLGHKEGVERVVSTVIQNVEWDNFMDKAGTANTWIMDNRMTLGEGVQAVSAQRLGRAAETIASALCNAVPGKPGGEIVLHLFEGLPETWDAEFELCGGNGYWVKGCSKNGKIERVELISKAGLSLIVKNPWENEQVCVDYGDRKEIMTGNKLQITDSCMITLV